MLAFMVFITGTVEYIITGVIEMIANDLQITTSEAGQLVTIFALSSAIGTPIIIALTLKLDRKVLLIASLIVFTLSNASAYFVTDFASLMALRIVQGVSTGVFAIVAISIATRLVSPEKRGNAIGIILMGLGASLVLGVPLGTMLSDVMGWRALFLLIAILTLVPIGIISVFVPRTKAENGVSLRSQISILKNIRILAALLITLSYISGYAILFTYLTPFLQSQIELTTKEISFILLILGIVSIGASKMGGYSADHWGTHSTLYFTLSIHAVMLFLLPVVIPSTIGTVIILMIWAAVTWMTSPTQQLYLVTSLPESPDIALSVNTSFIQLGFALGAGLGGYVITKTSILNLSLVGGIIVLIGLITAFLLFSLTKKTLSTSLHSN